MGNLLEIANLAWENIYPEPRDKTAISLESFIASAKVEYASSMWIYRQQMLASDGAFQMPSELLTEKELPVVGNKIDLSKIDYLSALPGDLWLQNLGGIDCKCKYVKTTLNLAQTLCDDDSQDDSTHLYYIVGKSIVFLKEPHKNPLPIIYANTGTGIDERVIEVNDYVASKVRDKLMQLYGKRMPVDSTNNQNSDT